MVGDNNVAPVAADYYVLNSGERQKSAARQQIKADASTRFRFSLDSQQQSLPAKSPQTTRFQSDFSSFATPIENGSVTPRPPTPPHPHPLLRRAWPWPRACCLSCRRGGSAVFSTRRPVLPADAPSAFKRPNLYEF